MNSSNSFGFVLVGLTMALAPVVMPQGFPPTGFDGTSTRAIWLATMGFVQVAIGISYLLQIWVHRLADRLATVSFPLLDRSPAPARLPSERLAFE